MKLPKIMCNFSKKIQNWFVYVSLCVSLTATEIERTRLDYEISKLPPSPTYKHTSTPDGHIFTNKHDHNWNI